MMQLINHPVNVLIANYGGNMMTSGTIRSYADITNDGQMALVDWKNEVISPTAIAAYTTPTKLVVRNGNELLYSEPFIGSKIVSEGSVEAAAETQQVTYLGYNGTSGSIDVFDQNTYMVHLELMDDDIATFPYPYMKFGTYASGVDATEVEVVFGLTKSLVENFKRESEVKVNFNAVCSHAGTALGAATDTVVGKKGSKVLVVTDTDDDDTVIAVTVGDFIRLGTATTAPVYKIVSGELTVSGGTVVLDRPLSADVSLVGNTSEYITAAQGAASTWGIKMEGVKRTTFVAGTTHHYTTTFKVGLSGFDATTITYTTAAAKGSGTYEEVANMEYITQGNTGKLPYIGVPPFTPKSVTNPTLTYDKVTVTYYEEGYEGLISNNPKNARTLVIYSSSSDASPNDELKTIFGIS